MKICVVTGTRADYGLLRPVMHALAAHDAFQLQVVATAMHLSPEFGLTYKVIEADGFPIDAKVDCLLSSDTGIGTAKAIGLATAGLADAFARLEPDLVMLLGDRFETLAAAQTALVMALPVAHLSGGDVTHGAFDDAIRHGITKMAHIHFVASDEAARRVCQLGEDPASVHAVGDPGLDGLRALALWDRARLEQDPGVRFRDRNLLITFHPVTLGRAGSTDQFTALLDALDRLGPEVGLIFTRPNADPEGRALIRALDEFVAAHDNASAFVSLGQERYLSLMATVDAVVGNSSSGLLEAPSLATPAINIGDRQAGRLRAASVIDCPAEAEAIVAAIDRAYELDCGGVTNPYGDGHAADRIVSVLLAVDNPKELLHKQFRDLAFADA